MLKRSDIIAVFKKLAPSDQTNQRPVSIKGI